MSGDTEVIYHLSIVKNQPRPGKAFGLVLSSNSHGDVIIMPYKDRLESWAVIRLLPKMQRVVVARRRTASDAEDYYQILCRLEPTHQFIVVFDPVFDDRPVNGDT